ncbi:hypothetical protein Tco_0832614 [Tanacetum coccineum]
MPYRIDLGWSIATSNLVTIVVVVLQLGTFPLEVSLDSILKTRILTVTTKCANFVSFVAFRSACPCGDNCILSIGVWIPHIVSSQQSLQHNPCRCSASCFGGVVVVVGYYLAFFCSLSDGQQKCGFSYPSLRLPISFAFALS